MAEVEIQRKQGGVPWWAWLLGVLAVAAILWWIIDAATADRDAEVATTTPTVTEPAVTSGTQPAPTPGAEAATAELPLAAIAANPDAYFGKPVSGLATVTEVVGDRGFWVEQDGNRMFVVKAEPLAESANIVAGNRVSFTGTVINPDNMQQQVPGLLQMDESTLKMMQGLPAFIHATNIEMQNA